MVIITRLTLVVLVFMATILSTSHYILALPSETHAKTAALSNSKNVKQDVTISTSGASTSSISDPISTLKQALQLHKENKLLEAAAAYRSVLPYLQSTTRVTVLTNLGRLLIQLGDLEGAKQAFQTAIDDDSKSSVRYLNMAIFQFQQLQDYNNALSYVEKAILYDNTNSQAMHMAALIYQSLGDETKAAEYFKFSELIASKQEAAQQATRNFSLKSYIGVLRDLKSTCAVTCRGLIKISNNPPIFFAPNFLTEEETEYLKSSARGLKFDSSTVMSDQSGSVEVNEIPYRHSATAWLEGNDVTQQIQRRLGQMLDMSPEYIIHSSEPLQLVRYGLHGQYLVHPDSLSFHKRIFTALMYLESPDNGGQTWFPFASTDDSSLANSLPWLQFNNPLIVPSDGNSATAVDLAMAHYSNDIFKLPGLTVKPPERGVLVFFNHVDDGSIDPASVHAGLPVLSGQKLIANDWVVLNEKGLATYS